MPNAFTTLVGIEFPIVLAAMGGATSPQFAAAVSNAGGLGMLALGWSPPEAVRAEIRATKALTKRPFGVHLVLTYPQEERLAICLEEGVSVVSFFWGQAGSLMAAAHRGGAKVLHTAGGAEQARISAADGADAIVAQGWEAGGHVYGTVATMASAVVDQVAPVPVLAAGCIADGRGLAAAMALGAAGTWIGTRFLASIEAPIHPRYRDRILTAKETDTEYGTVFDVGWPDAPHRSLRNKTIEAREAAGRPPAGRLPTKARSLQSRHMATWLHTNLIRRDWVTRAISTPLPYGQAKASASSAASRRPPRLSAKSATRRGQSSHGLGTIRLSKACVGSTADLNRELMVRTLVEPKLR